MLEKKKKKGTQGESWVKFSKCKDKDTGDKIVTESVFDIMSAFFDYTT